MRIDASYALATAADPGHTVRAAFATRFCLTDEPAPDALHTAIDVLATEERARAMEALPWMAAVGGNEPGLLRCVRCMLHPEQPEPYSDDPWSTGP
ncbi:hypothetical protein ACFWUZ_34260 [Streptomyces sp. NPDC058646]|uniref:hypothetical protein n=1 Tax=Streptomyces sp. NPDC058646 TaxID=3346574 RepID=UPI0036668C26